MGFLCLHIYILIITCCRRVAVVDLLCLGKYILLHRKYYDLVLAFKMASANGRLVLIGVDDSEHSSRSFDWYLKNMHQEGSTVGILHVHDISNAIVKIPLGSDLPADAIEKIIQKGWEKVDNLIDKYKKKCEEFKVKYVVFVETSGKPGEAVCKIAKDKNAKMIVLGSRGLGTIRRTLLGSVSHYVVHHADIPVTVIPPISH